MLGYLGSYGQRMDDTQDSFGSEASDTKISHLGSTLEDVVEKLKEPIDINGRKVTTGIPKGLKSKRIRAMGIEYDATEGEFVYREDNSGKEEELS